METVDRLALIVTPKRRFFDWVNGLPQADERMTIDQASSLRAVYLVATGDGAPDLEEIIDTYHAELFEEVLAGWTMDESFWPANRTPHTFRDWFQVECIDLVADADPAEPLLVSERIRTRCANCDAPLGDGVIFVGLGEGGARRLTADEAAANDDDPEDEVTDAAASDMIVLRCCGSDCAAHVERAYARALEQKH